VGRLSGLLFEFEYGKLGIPAPALVVYLRVDPAVSQALMTGRYRGDEEKKDIHERDVAYLEKCRTAADCCAGRLGWRVVECCRGGAMRPAEEIHEEILRLAAAEL
jgi:dTMP kinase